jgi:hypothetical protein
MGPHKDLEGIARALSGQPRPESGPNVPRCVPLHGRRVKRSTPLARTGRLPRHTPMAAVNKRRKGHRFPKGVDEGFREHVRGLPCLLAGLTSPPCAGPTEPDHVTTRGAGGADRENLTPLCSYHHGLRHTMGVRSFQKHYDLDLRAAAARVWADHRGDE